MLKKCDWDKYLDKQDHNVRLVRKIFSWGIFCILVGMIIFKSIALIPKSEPENHYEQNYIEPTSEGEIYFDTDTNSIHIISADDEDFEITWHED